MLIASKTINKINLFILLIAFPCNLSGQEFISGKIVDSEKKPIFAANIYSLKNPAVGTVSNMDGLFKLLLENKILSDTIVFSCMQYVTKMIPMSEITLNDSIEIELIENDNVIGEIVIMAQPSMTKEFSIKELDRISIYMSPVSNGDPLKAISFLPYSTNTSESANPELRGSSSDFSRVVVNNVPVYDPVKNTQLNGMGNFSLLSTEIIEEQLVYAGNPPLKYGNSIAGLVEIKTIKELKKAKELKLSASLANAGLLYSQKINNKSFYQVYGNHQFSSPYLGVNKKNSSYIKDFSNSDIGLNFHQQLSNKLSANIYSYAIMEKFNADNFMYNYLGNMFATAKRNFNIVNIEHQDSFFSFSFNNGTNFSTSNFEFGNIANQQKERQIYTSIDSKIIISPNVSFQTGISHDYSKEIFSNTLPYYRYAIFPSDTTYSFINNTHNHNVEVYSYGKMILGNFIWGIGLRKNIPVDNQNNYLSYQTNLKYNINTNHAFILSGGKYNGYSIPNYIIESFHLVSSDQLAIEYLHHTNQYNINFSLYTKREKQPVYYPELGEQIQTNLKISGAEFSLDFSLDKFYFFGSYVWLYSKFNNGSGWFKSYNDMNYFLRSSISYLNDKWINASINFTFHPGLYYTPVSMAKYNDNANNYEPQYNELNSAQYKNYSSIDLTLNKIISYHNCNIVVFTTLSNLLNTHNEEKIMYNYDYSLTSYWLYQKRLLYFGVTISI
jgi:hypothetical protein